MEEFSIKRTFAEDVISVIKQYDQSYLNKEFLTFINKKNEINSNIVDPKSFQNFNKIFKGLNRPYSFAPDGAIVDENGKIIDDDSTDSYFSIMKTCVGVHEFNKNKKMFLLSEGLMQKLSFTDLTEVSGNSIQLPFDSFLIQLPKNNGLKMSTKLWMAKQQDKDKVYKTSFDIDEIYVFKTFDSNENINGFNVISVSHELLELYRQTIDKTLDEKNVPKNSIHRETFINSNILGSTRHFNFTYELTDEDVLKTFKINFNSKVGIDWTNELTEIIKLILNVVLYINYSKADKQKVKNKRSNDEKYFPNKKNGFKTTRIPEPTLLGKNIIIDHIDRNNDGNSSNGKYTGHLMWWVRGHWRNLSNRKDMFPNNPEKWKTWIKPYVKGNLEGEMINHKYEIK